MKEWFNGLEPRERKLLVAAAAIVTIMIVYLAVWDPMVTKLERLKNSTQQQQVLIAWMEDTAREVKQLRQSALRMNPSKKIQGQSLLGIIDRTAKNGKLGSAVKRVKPDGESKAQVWLENASFNDMLAWLEKLQRQQGIRVVTTVIEKQSEAGRVNARLVFRGSSV
ncbi:MAG: type II secretion system protein M [Gammaproteobacteria bacterium]|nr:type II secretion system protein M [Gammaproteobacteria bacterium]